MATRRTHAFCLSGWLAGCLSEEYAPKQASAMHDLCRYGILAAAAHTDALLVGRCGRFDLLSVCKSKASTHSTRRSGNKSARRSARAQKAASVQSIGVLPHDADSEPVELSGKVYVSGNEMQAVQCRIALAAQLSGAQPVPDYVEFGKGPAARVVVVVGGGGADVQAAALMCVERGWPTVVLAAASSAAAHGALPLAGVGTEGVHVFGVEHHPSNLGVLLHTLLVTSPESRGVRRAGGGRGAGTGASSRA